MGESDGFQASDVERAVREFLDKRCADKIDQEKKKRSLSSKEARAIKERYETATWLADAARRAKQLKIVTHTVKGINSSARGSSVFMATRKNMSETLISSNDTIGAGVRDVVGNAASLDVYAFLNLPVGTVTILDLMIAQDARVLGVMSTDREIALQLLNAFLQTLEPDVLWKTHTLAKQVYWLMGDNPARDDSYRILAPLFPSVLVHQLFTIVESSRFGESSKLARAAHSRGEYSDQAIHSYPGLAIQQLGGSKPQNVSQLNNERSGRNYLLSSLPPRWKSTSTRRLIRATSVFNVFDRRIETRTLVQKLRKLFGSSPSPNRQTRDSRDGLVTSLVHEFVELTFEFRSLPVGWTSAPECRLAPNEKVWFDSEGLSQSARDAIPEMSRAFARWLNEKLRDPLPMGDSEFLHWCKIAESELYWWNEGEQDD